MRNNHHHHHRRHHHQEEQHNHRNYISSPQSTTNPQISTQASSSSQQQHQQQHFIHPQGQMIINMKTTVTTSGGQHNGLVVHSAIQSSQNPQSTSNSWMSTPYVESPNGRIEMLTSNSSLHRIGSPLPVQMVPSTSRETLVSKKEKDSRTSSPAFRNQPQPPSPPASPIYSFNGRNSPPDEFIQPTKLILNVFQPTHREPSYQTTLSRNQVTPDYLQDSSGGISLSKKNALLNDSVTTTTTVEVFRAPLDDNVPVIGLPSSPYGGQPLLIRTHGTSPYEKWSNTKKQTMINDDAPIDGNYYYTDNGISHPSSTKKGIQWKDGLVDESRYLDSSDYEEIETMPHPDAPTINAPQFINNDYRPKQYQPMSHPILSNSVENLSRRNQPPPAYNNGYTRPSSNNGTNKLMSPLYIVPDRRSLRNENGQDERYNRRSKSSTRNDIERPRSLRHRSTSPVKKNRYGGSQEFVFTTNSPIGSTLMLASPDPNELPGRPASARSQEIFALYQTRDAYNRIIDQL